MYAIFMDRGRQYKAQEGQTLDLDYRDAAAGDPLRFEEVVAFSDGSDLQLGAPTLSGAVITAKVLGVFAGPKIVVQKLRRRKNSRRRTGHRQLYTKIEIQGIQGPGSKD